MFLDEDMDLYITMISGTYHQGVCGITGNTNDLSTVGIAISLWCIHVTATADPRLKIKSLNPTTSCTKHSKIATSTDGAGLSQNKRDQLSYNSLIKYRLIQVS